LEHDARAVKQATDRELCGGSPPPRTNLQGRRDGLYNFLDRQAFFQDEDKRRYFGTALVITCDMIGEMEITINEASKWQKD
jgi:hypothetical protein